MARKRKCWSFSAGVRPNTVRVYERVPGGPLYVRVWDTDLRDGRGDWMKVSLKHKDRQRAKAYALEQASKLQEGDEALRSGRIPLSRIFTLYERHRSPLKDAKTQKADSRKARMWVRLLGADKDPHQIPRRELESFVRDRGSGEINAEGERIEPGQMREAGPRTVGADLIWLKAVLNWATDWQLSDGRFLMRENPIRGFQIPREKNPKRPVATQDRYEATRAVSDDVMMTVYRGGDPEGRRSYLSEILDLARATGRRISAIRRLRYSDLLLERNGEHYPNGRIHWPSETDKGGQEWIIPMDSLARSAIDRIMEERPGIGEAPLFPSPKDPTKAVGYRLTVEWLAEAEAKAGLEPLEGGKWHPYRRMWATSRKGHPVQDVARAGGWKTTSVVENIYQAADDETTLKVVLEETHMVGRKTG